MTVSAGAGTEYGPSGDLLYSVEKPESPPEPCGFGGPDEYGYRWIDSDEPDGPEYEWVDITGTGSRLEMGDDDNQGPFELGFQFEFYGRAFSLFQICSNGWISFTSTSVAHDNLTLPNPDAPRNLIAGFWDDLNPELGGEIWYYTGGDSAIVSFIDIYHYDSGGPYTFQFIILSDGRVLIQYNSMGFRLNEATVGIQNETGDIGLQVAYNEFYVHDALALLFELEPSGFVSGIVTDAETSEPIEDAVISSGARADTTDENGEYTLELSAGYHSMTAAAQYYNTMTVDSIEVLENDTTELDFELLHPELSVNTDPIMIFIQPGTTQEYNLVMTNTGNGELTYTIRLRPVSSVGEHKQGVDNENDNHYRNPAELAKAGNREFSRSTDRSENLNGAGFPAIDNFSDELFTFDPQGPTGDVSNLGVEFDGTHFWVTGRDPDHGDVHKLHKFDIDGNYITSYEQGTTSDWGWRDLAWDGAYLYASDENELAIIDTADGNKIGEIPRPNGFTGVPCRGLAYDPEDDHFWTANWNSPIVEFDRSGEIINSYPNPMQVYGLAWDDVSRDGPWLWVFSQDSYPYLLISRFDPFNGEYTGVTFMAVDHTGGEPDMAGGAAFTDEWDLTRGMLFVLIQGTYQPGDSYDLVAGYEITSRYNWLTFDPNAGTIAANSFISVTLTFDAGSPMVIPDTTYRATALIMNNSRTPAVEIPVSMYVRPTGISEEGDNLPREFALHQNYPNPFNPATTIEFALPVSDWISLEIFNVRGRKVTTLYDGFRQAGYHEITWDGTDDLKRPVSSGIYFCRLKSSDKTIVRKMSLIK